MLARGTTRAPYLARLWAELGREGGKPDVFIKAIIVERISKAIVLISVASGLLVAGEKGWLAVWADHAQDQLNLNVGHGLIVQLLLRTLLAVGSFSHVTLVAIGAIT